MKICVIGSGAIGSLVAGYLKLLNQDVTLVARPETYEAINKNGLLISGARGDLNVKLNVARKMDSDADLIIFATKTQDLNYAIKQNQNFLNTPAILTTQNGVRADDIISQYIPKQNIISSIVMFGATYLEPGKIVHNFEGRWIMGRPYAKNDALVEEVAAVLKKIFPVVVTDEIWGMKWLKIFVNANNCIPAIIGKSMQEVFSDTELCKISLNIWREGLNIVNSAGIKLISLPDFSLERITKLLELNIETAAKVFSSVMINLSKEPLYGSILQSIKRGRQSEIDFINGEFVSLAKNSAISASLNERLVNMVRKVEVTKKFFTKEELLENVKELVK